MLASSRALAALFAFACACSLQSGKADAADTVLRFGSINTAGTPAYDQVLEPFARKVEADSAGQIEVAVKPLGGYGKPSELFNMVEHGDIEIAATVQGYNPGRFPQSSVMELPLMHPTAVAGTEAMMKMYKEGLFDRDYGSVKVLALYVLPPYGIFSTGKPITQLRDMRGMRVRTPSPTVGLALARMGMIPIGVPLDLMGDMLASNTLDAVTYGWDSLTTTKGAGGKMVADQVKVLIDANFAAPTLMVVMNKAKWESLPPAMQAIIEKDSASLAMDNARMRDESENNTRNKLRNDPRFTYVPVSGDLRVAMEQAIAPAIADWKTAMARQNLDGEKLYNRARELLRGSTTASR